MQPDYLASTLPSDLRDQLALHLVPGLGPRLTEALVERFGTIAAILRATADQLRQVAHIGDKLAGQLAQAIQQVNVNRELELMARLEVTLRVLGESSYPAALATIAVPPRLLYVRGELLERDANGIAIVGSRLCTPYGKRIAERLAASLARANYTIVSGLARGIDGCAHRGALQAGGRTLAILAGGLSKIYPPEHAELAEQVRASGALVSESAMLMEPMAGMFPARNRIISGLSRAVIVVEANEKSGALITARHAAEQGRPVFALPGPVDSLASAGTNRLIRNGAVLVRGVEDVLEELHGIASAGSSAPVVATAPPTGLDETQQRIWTFLGNEPRHLDEMVQQLGISVAQLSGALVMMEMKKAVRRLPGNRFERAT